MIAVENLTKKFGDTVAVDGLNFTVEPGTTLALIGPSGSGKTTTLRMLNRLIEPDAGQILLNGENIILQPLEEMRRRMGYVIQNIGLFPHYTVEENVAVVPTLLRWDRLRTQKRVHSLLEQVGLPPTEYASKYPSQLSGGQQQRVGFARALAADPPIILMDEPFGALDPVTRRNIRREMLQLEEFATKTIILVTHDVEEAFEMADLICLLDKGKIQQLDTQRRLLEQPASDFVTHFFAGQRFQLRLMTYHLAEIFEALPLLSSKPTTLFFTSKTSLRQAMDALSEKPHEAAIVEKNGEKRFVDIQKLIDAAYSSFTSEGVKR